MYADNKSPLQSGLILTILKCFIAKANSHRNHKYSVKVESVMLALASVKKPAFELVLGNLGLVSERHARHLSSKHREPPYVSITKDNIGERIVKQIGIIQEKTVDTTGRRQIAFPFGVDPTACVQGWDILQSTQAIVGGASPHHFIDICGLSSEEVKSQL